MFGEKINIYRIAEETGVSIATVSRVIHKRAGVSESLRKKINSVLEKYDFRPSYPSAKLQTVGIIAADCDFGDYATSVLSGVYDYVREFRMGAVLISCAGFPKDSIVQEIRERQCAALIIVGSARLQNSLRALSETGLPVVCVDGRTDLPGIALVDHDSYGGSMAAFKHLFELGHRKIGYLASCYNSYNHECRLNAYIDGFKDAGLSFEPSWIVNSENTGTIYEQGYDAMTLILKRNPEITALMAAGDSLAVGAMHACSDMKLVVPDDISIVGFDNYLFCSHLNPPLTTVNHPSREEGYQAAKFVDMLMANGGRTDSALKMLFPTELVVRNSTCRCGR